MTNKTILQTILKEQEQELEEISKLDCSKKDLLSIIKELIEDNNAKIIKAVCEEMEKRNRNEDGTIDYNVDTFIAGYNYRESLLFKVAKQLIKDTIN